MAKKIRVIVPATEPRQGRPAKFGIRMERQVSVGIDPLRSQLLSVVQQHLQKHSIAVVSESDVMRHAFDNLVTSLRKEVPELNEISDGSTPASN